MLAAALLIVSPAARAVARWVLRGLGVGVVALVALAVLAARRRHHARPVRAQHLPTGQWHIRVWVRLDSGRAVPLRRGVVPGQWASPTDAEADVLARWVRLHGWPATGRLCAKAEPVNVPGAVVR